MVGIKVSFTLFTFCSSNLLHNLDDVHRDRTLGKASAASDTAKHTVVVFGVVHQLVHKSLAETLLLGKSVVSVRHFGKLGIHTGVPATEANDTVARAEILDVVALAGGANEGAGTAAQTGSGQFLPSGMVKQLLRLAAAKRSGGNVSPLREPEPSDRP